VRRFVVASLAICLYFQAARAELDAVNQNVLINKLEMVYRSLADKDASKVGVTLRLADLYAERARQAAAKDLEGGASLSGTKADRDKALRLYSEVIDRAPETARGKIVMQMGHLHQMNGQEDKAIALYMKNTGSEEPAVRAEAHLSLGEIYFKRRDFPKAISHYDKVMELPKSAGKGLAAYRRAWSHFNLKQIPVAISEIEGVLKSPELLSRSAADRAQIDNAFHDEVARDYVTFLAQAPVTKEKVDSLMELSPANSKIQNGQALAYELERLGKKDEALMTWGVVGGFIANPSDRMASQIAMAQLHLDKNDKPAALKSYEQAMSSWKDTGFKNTPQETELKRRARHFVVAWNQTEKKTPSPELLAAYDQYLAVFPGDTDAQVYAGQVAMNQKDYVAAMARYTAARDLLLKEKDDAKLEDVVLTQIEIAESAKDAAMAQAAYSSYIQYSPKKTKLLEVQYQKAKALYDKGDYLTASGELRAIAVGGKSNPALRKQAADLSLDALVLIKDEAKLMTWAREYEAVFTNDKSDFSQIIQKGILTKSAQQAEADPKAALATLNEFDASKASAEDKAKFYKNKMILAEKAGDLTAAAGATDALLALPNISKEDRELAWGRKAYFAEMRLDFSTAFAATEKLEKTLAADEKAFKLAVFAELSGRQSSNFYMNYLTQAKDAERKRLVAAELVRKSKTPDLEIEKVRNVLSADPALLAQLYTEAYAKTGKEAVAKKVTADAKMRETDSGKLLQRQGFLKEFAAIKKTLVNDKLDTANNNKLAASIKRRGNLLTKAEDFTKRAIQSGDWTAQLVSIDLLAKESERFYQDLLSAPVPQGLSPEEEQQYLSLLNGQAMPYQTKSAEAKAKVGQFWTADWQGPLTASWQHKPIRKLIQTEIDALKEIAPQDQLAKLNSFKEAATLAEKPSTSEMQSARQAVFNNPNDRKALEQLLALERKSDNLAMSEYLATRLNGLNKGQESTQ
jgi:hypothetical protein